MNATHKEMLSMLLSIVIIFLSLFIIHRFIPSILWAAIIVIATYPLYSRWCRFFPEYPNLSAFIFTLILSLIFIIPVSWLVGLLVNESQILINYLQSINRNGGMAPIFLKNVPLVGNDMISYWNNNIGQPGNLKDVLSNLHLSLAPTSYYIKQIGSNLAHRGFQLGFTVLCLFFFYRDGDKLIQQVNHVGESWLGLRWFRYAKGLPGALQATVNGTIVVGIGVGICMGICYALLGVPGPTLLGFMTALASMIPFVVPLVFLFVALLLLVSGSMISALIVIVWGTFVMFVADHFIKPVLIGGAIQLPFLAVLFGILGGIETLGLLGLFVGPVVMVLFITLWNEAQEDSAQVKKKA